MPVAIIAIVLTMHRQADRGAAPRGRSTPAERCSSAPAWPRRARTPAGQRVGLEQPRDVGVPGRRPAAARRVRPLRAADRTTRSCRCGCSPTAASRSTTSCCCCCRSASCRCSSSPASTRRSRSARAPRTRASSCSCSSSASRSAPRWGGRILDSRGARPTVVLGCAVAAVGFYLWGEQARRDLSFS